MFEEIGKLSLPSREILDVGAQDVAVSSEADLEFLMRAAHPTTMYSAGRNCSARTWPGCWMRQAANGWGV